MNVKNQDIIIRQTEVQEAPPYELLLLADPSKKLIDEYLKHSFVFTAIYKQEVIGVLVLLPLTNETAEIKNVAVKPELQGRGIGSYMIEYVIHKTAALKKFKTICIGTANSSIGQLYLYQKLGFELSEVKKNFFTDNYPEPIYENGIQAKHLLLLTRSIEKEEGADEK